MVLTNVAGVADGTNVALEQSGAKVRASNFIWEGTTFVTAGTSYTSAKGFMGIYQSTPELMPQNDADLIMSFGPGGDSPVREGHHRALGE